MGSAINTNLKNRSYKKLHLGLSEIIGFVQYEPFAGSELTAISRLLIGDEYFVVYRLVRQSPLIT